MPNTAPTLYVRNEDLIYYLGKELTYLTVANAATATSLTVQDNRGISQNNFIGLGKPGVERSEVVMVNASVTAGTALTTTATVFAHAIDTPIIKLPGDKIEFFYASTKTGSKTSLGSPAAFDYDDEYSRFTDTTNTSGYFFVKIYNSNTGAYVSDYIGPWSYSGATVETTGGIRRVALNREGERISVLISQEFLDDEMKLYRRFIKEEINVDSDRDTSLSLVAGKQRYAVPSGVKGPESDGAIVDITLGSKGSLTPIKWDEYIQKLKGVSHATASATASAGATSLTLDNSHDFLVPTTGTVNFQAEGVTSTYTTNTVSTGVLSGIPASSTGSITTAITSGDDVWQGLQDGLPSEFCVWDGYIYLWPVCSSTYAGLPMSIDFFRDSSTVLESTDPIDSIVELGVVWLQWRIKEVKKDPDWKEKKAEFFNLLQRYFGKNDQNVDTLFTTNPTENTYKI